MVTSAFAWIGQLVEWFGQFFPRWTVVRTTHGWVKWVRGTKVKTGGAGIVWYWPVISDFIVYPVERQTTPLPSQTITTTDNKTIAVSGMLVFKVTNIEKLIAYSYDCDDTLRDIAQSALTDVLGRMTWEQIKAGQGKTLDTRLKNVAKRDLEEYGVEVVKFSLTSLALCRVYRQIMSRFEEGEVR